MKADALGPTVVDLLAGLRAVPDAGIEFVATWAQALFHDQTVLNAESLDQMLDWAAHCSRD